MSRVIVYGHKATPAQLGAGVCFLSCVSGAYATHNTLCEGVDVDLLVGRVEEVVSLLAALRAGLGISALCCPNARICPEARHKARAHAHCRTRTLPRPQKCRACIPHSPPAARLPIAYAHGGQAAPRAAYLSLCTALARCSLISSSTLALILISLSTLSLTTPHTILPHTSVTPALYKVRW